MIRKTLLVITLLLLVGTVGVWVRSYWCGGAVFWSWNPQYALALENGKVGIWRIGWSYKQRGFHYRRWNTSESDSPLSSLRQVNIVGLPGFFKELVIPIWIPFLLFSSLTIAAFTRGPYRRHRRRKKGLCLTCGYDLTGNVSGRCSECGTIIEQPSTEVA